jgi:hypothetical protein
MALTRSSLCIVSEALVGSAAKLAIQHNVRWLSMPSRTCRSIRVTVFVVMASKTSREIVDEFDA